MALSESYHDLHINGLESYGVYFRNFATPEMVDTCSAGFIDGVVRVQAEAPSDRYLGT